MPLYSERNKTKLDGKIVAITGCNAGIGVETVLDMAKRGARVLMLCRNRERTQPTIDRIKEESGNDPVFYKLDLSSLKSVRECAEEIKSKEDKIDILINNAGVMMLPQSKTEDGFEKQFGTNHLGHFLLTELLMPLIKKSSESGFHPRIVILSSSANYRGKIYFDDVNLENNYGEVRAYCQSKLANVMHGKELAKRLQGTGITVYSLHPGGVATNLQDSAHNSGKWYGSLLRLIRPLFKTPLEGTQTTIYCALEEKIKDDSGKYYEGCKEKRPNRRALNEEDQKRLWELSEKMVGLN